MRTALASIAAFTLIAASARAETHDIPLDLTGPRPTVSLSINGGAPDVWTFDTGAMGSVISIDRAHALGLRDEGSVELHSPAGGTPMQGFLSTVTNVHIGAATVASMHVVAVPWDHEDTSGVLSPNVFTGQLVTFDFGHARVRVSDRTATAIPHGSATPYLGEGPHKLPAIPIALGDQSWTAHMDSGAPGGLTFPYAMAASLPLAAPPVQVGVAHFVDGVHPRYQATLNGQVRVGPLTLDHPQVEFIEGLPVLNVGMQLLTRMRITLDPQAQRDWAEAAE